MDTRFRARYFAWATVLKAMAPPTRLCIIDQLAEGERCVCESTGMKGSPNNMRRTVHHNARVIRFIPLGVFRRRSGRLAINSRSKPP